MSDRSRILIIEDLLNRARRADREAEVVESFATAIEDGEVDWEVAADDALAEWDVD